MLSEFSEAIENINVVLDAGRKFLTGARQARKKIQDYRAQANKLGSEKDFVSQTLVRMEAIHKEYVNSYSDILDMVPDLVNGYWSLNGQKIPKKRVPLKLQAATNKLSKMRRVNAAERSVLKVYCQKIIRGSNQDGTRVMLMMIVNYFLRKIDPDAEEDVFLIMAQTIARSNADYVDSPSWAVLNDLKNVSDPDDFKKIVSDELDKIEKNWMNIKLKAIELGYLDDGFDV